MRVASVIVLGLFGLAIVVQQNDPDPLLWTLVYGVPAALTFAAVLGLVSRPLVAALGLGYLIAAWRFLPAGFTLSSLSLDSFRMASLDVEETRESLGLALSALWMLILAFSRPRASARIAAALSFSALVLVSCTTTAPTRAHRMAPDAVEVSSPLKRQLVPRWRVATGLDNPRGLLLEGGRTLLVSVAGDGNRLGEGSGALLRFEDLDGDGTFVGDGERRTLLGGQSSRNIVSIVRRDEVFGMAGIAEGDGTTLVSLAYFGGPSSIYRVGENGVTEWSRIHGNINHLAYDPDRKLWFGVSSSSDEVVRLQEGRGAHRILKIAPLPGGQDPVPGYLRHDSETGHLLVTLFSGSPQGEEGGRGIELEPGAGGVVRVNPDNGDMDWVVTGLTAPTDLEIGPDGKLYVLEFCSDFEDPVDHPRDLWTGASHGGFRRFSGRLLEVGRESGEVTVLAEGLDAPTNLALHGNDLYIAQGMGTPGRPIPGPQGVVPLTGFIEKLVLPAGPRGQ